MKKLISAMSFGLIVAAPTQAEDIDIYLNNIAVTANERPQVLLIFDNSRSMTESIEVQREYEISENYPYNNSGAIKFDEGFLYWLLGNETETQLVASNKPRRFADDNNACNSSVIPLYGLFQHNDTGAQVTGLEILEAGTGYSDYTKIAGGVGKYTDGVSEYSNSKLTWQDLPSNNGANSTNVVECLQDIINKDPANPGGNSTGKYSVQTGLPVDGYKDGSGNYFSHVLEADAEYANKAASFANISTATLYTGHYLNYLNYLAQSTSNQTTTKQRIAVARDAVLNLIESTPGIDYGVMLFNKNGPEENQNDGGRIVSAISADTSNLKSTLINLNGDTMALSNNSPLCETFYEASRYFRGLSPHYADENGTTDGAPYGFESLTVTPAKDPSAESGGLYDTPFQNVSCSDNVYVIIISDGLPTLDNSADSSIASLISGDTQAQALVKDWLQNDVDGDTSNDTQKSYLPALASYLSNNDIDGDASNGEQYIKTYVIGFIDPNDATLSDEDTRALELLNNTADASGTSYYSAIDYTSLVDALDSVTKDITYSNGTFSSPGIASNSYNSLRSLEGVYYSMFDPEINPRWRGNIKKFKVKPTASGDFQVVDSTDKVALDDATGAIKPSATSFWGGTDKTLGVSGTGQDGANVDQGGVAEMLAGMNPSAREVYTNADNNQSLLEFKVGMSVTNQVSKFDVVSVGGGSAAQDAAVNDLINWAKGQDLDDEDNDNDTADMRDDVFGDPLHSQPLVISYGGGDGSDSQQDIRIIVGTNAGFVHMFKDYQDAVTESWSFIPQQLYKNLKSLRANDVDQDKLYGMDGSPSAYVLDANGDGIIKKSDNDKVYLYIGMRRGGLSYFAFDITEPDSPSLMWSISGSTTDFPNLASTWSRPIVTRVNTTVNGHKVDEPVLIFGAGYVDDNVRASIDVGCGIYMVNGVTGEKIHQFADCSDSSEMQHQFPAPVAILDSDNDGFTDRFYAADTGGNVWRVDLPYVDGKDTNLWSIVQFAELSGVTSGSSEPPRQFFSQPAIARSIIDDVDASVGVDDMIVNAAPFDAIVLGSGDRTEPNLTSANDALFVLQDRNIATQTFKSSNKPAVIDENLLYKANDQSFDVANDEQLFLKLSQHLAGKRGWIYELDSGEKSLSTPRVLGGVAYFPSYTPAADTDILCGDAVGDARLYTLNFLYGQAVNNKRYIEVGENQVSVTPVVYSGEVEVNGKKQNKLAMIGVGGEEDGAMALKDADITGQCANDAECDASMKIKSKPVSTVIVD